MDSSVLQPSMCLKMMTGRATKMRHPNRMKISVEMTRIFVWLTFHFWWEIKELLVQRTDDLQIQKH